MSVLVGFAPTPEGRAAVRRAVAECALRGTKLILVSSERQSGEPLTADDCRREISEACADLGVSDPGHEIRLFTGSVEPADDVLNVAEEQEADLIVIGLRRRTPVGKLILGGSVQRILLEAACPVLAVKNVPARAMDRIDRIDRIDQIDQIDQIDRIHQNDRLDLTSIEPSTRLPS